MKPYIYAITISVLAATFVLAGDRDKAAEHEKWMKHAMEKEQRRAQEAKQHHGNAERFEQKYGWAKEKQPAKYQALLAANKKAETAWGAVAEKSKTVKNYEDLSGLKLSASAAAGNAYLAEIDLKFAAAADGRKDMLTKVRSNTVKAAVAKLDANERDLLAAQRRKHEASLAIQKLELENRELNKSLREAYETARSKSK